MPAHVASDPRELNNSPPPLQLSTFLGYSDPNRLLNYLHKYPADKKGKELDPDSRTWKVYVDEHESYDCDVVKGFRDNIDALLVFAALFSSVITGFVGPAIERLEPNIAQMNTSILFEATQLLRANGNATLIDKTPRSELRFENAIYTTADVCVAWMFFASLALSLATALVSILAKQWLQEFTALVPGDAKRRSLTRQFRFAGMQKWKFAEIVGFLPLLLHLSLLLFFVGLCVYVERYHWSFLTMLGFVSLDAVIFYLVTAALPAVYLDCPYRIPILFIPASACVYAWKLLRYYTANLWSSIGKLRKPFSSSSDSPQTAITETHEQISRSAIPPSSGAVQEGTGQVATTSFTAQLAPHNPISRPLFVPLPLSTQEHKYVKENTRSLEVLSFEWLYEQTTNTSVQRIALHALARALEKHASCPLNEAESTPPLPRLLEEMHLFTLSIINGISGPEHIADDIPQLLDFHIHSSHALNREKEFPASRWPSLIESPHLLSFTERELLPLNDTFTVEDRTDYPLRVACRSERWDFIEEHDNDFPDSQWTKADSLGWLPLGWAAKSDKISIEQWKKILQRKTYTLRFSVNEDGDTPLHLICSYGANLAKIKVIPEFTLLRCLNVQRRDGQTPLHCLCYTTENASQRLEVAKYLLSKGADLGIVDSDQATPLHYACWQSHSTEFIETLCAHLQAVENGWDILNRREKDGWTALHCGVAFGDIDSQSVLALISAGADPNIANKDRNLPLHFACFPLRLSSPPRPEIIAILLDHTNDINQRNEKNETPLDRLMKYNLDSKIRQNVHELMREKGAKMESELEPALETDSGQGLNNEVEQE